MLAKTVEKVPDMFKNCKLKNPKTFLQYPKISKKGLEVPKHYVKHIEPVYPEKQSTVKKCWSFNKKIYEITEEKINELRQNNIDISPSDYEWVIDTFEKLAIND